MFNRKFSSNIRRKKRMMISSIILLVVFLGIGYSAFTTNLGINGTLKVDKYDQTLYGVLEKAAKKGTYAKEYTGNHQDSMAGVGTEKIYHWYAPIGTAGNTLANEILDKNNVIFADHCWQMIRTTDTGGVKMVYNGEPENNQCLNTRGNHIGYAQRITQQMSTTYYYGTSYVYDKTSNTFSLAGTVTTGTIQVGQYTCKSTSSNGTCASLYLLDTLSSGTTYYVLPINNNSDYSQFGKLQFNSSANSPAYVGYMYNMVYPIISKSNIFRITQANSWVINSNYYYSDAIDYNTATQNEYTLINPVTISTLSDYTTLVGKYVLSTSGTHGDIARYVIAVNGNNVYYRELKNGDINTSLTVGDSYIKSGNTYTLTNPTHISYLDWYNNTSDYGIYKGKYVCDGNNTSCTTIRHISVYSPSRGYYYYVDTTNTYSYSESVSYSGGTYTLTGDIKTFWDLFDGTNQSYLSTHHYTCLENGTSCSTVNYIVYINSYALYYAQLSNVSNASVALNNMLSVGDVNQTNSVMKTGIDAWYKRYMTRYTFKLEDIIFCNDRSIVSLGGWNSNGGEITNSSYNYLKFKNYNSNIDLNCTNITDKFSVSNNSAKLTYPVGLLTYLETLLSNNNNIQKTGQYWWIGSAYYSNESAYERIVDDTGNSGRSTVSCAIAYGVRPVISLKPETEYASGTGSMADPYVVDVPMATLRIYYKSDTGATLHETYVETMPVGASYSVTSPIISGYTTTQQVVADVMGKNGANISVIYYPEADPIIG
ncbi:MAG: hypothetical protein IJG97_05695 [Bacilli bacterium]|nr:hypothetical protein [Bacilli bacterium]